MTQKIKLEYFTRKEKQDEQGRSSKNIDELLDIRYVRIANKIRNDVEEKAPYFVISETLK
jgi:hypothetical protein